MSALLITILPDRKPPINGARSDLPIPQFRRTQASLGLGGCVSSRATKSSPPVTPDQFIAKWKATELKERSAAQSHFIDLCRLLDEPAPTDAEAARELDRLRCAWLNPENRVTRTPEIVAG